MTVFKVTPSPKGGQNISVVGAVTHVLSLSQDVAVIESAPTGAVPLGFRYLYSAPAIDQCGAPVCADSQRTLVCLGMNPNTAAMASRGELCDDKTTADLRRIAGHPLMAPRGHPFTRVVFLNMAPFRGILDRGGLAIADSCKDLHKFTGEHALNVAVVKSVLEQIYEKESSLNLVAMWGNTAKGKGNFAFVGVRDLACYLKTLSSRASVCWYHFGINKNTSPRNYAGLRYVKGISHAQKELREGKLREESLQQLAQKSPSNAWLSLADESAGVDAELLAQMLDVEA